MTSQSEPSEGSHPSPDQPPEYLLDQLQHALATAPGLYEQGIVVQVSGHRVLLSGSVPAPQVLDDINHVVHQVAPDLEIVNQVEVTPLTPPTEAEQL